MAFMQRFTAMRLWVIVALTITVLGTTCAPSGPVVKVQPSEPVQTNSEGRASVTVANIADLTAFEAHLSFDANALEVVELKEGGFVRADFVVQDTFDNAAGTIDYAVAQIDHPAANGSGTLFVIVFRSKAQGTFPIRFRETPAVPGGALFSDSKGVAIQVSLINGSIESK